jgi:hypothetical protein
VLVGHDVNVEWRNIPIDPASVLFQNVANDATFADARVSEDEQESEVFAPEGGHKLTQFCVRRHAQNGNGWTFGLAATLHGDHSYSALISGTLQYSTQVYFTLYIWFVNTAARMAGVSGRLAGDE